VSDPTAEFQSISEKVDAIGQTHIKMQQVYKGVKVYGSEVILHLDKKNLVRAFNGRSKPTPNIESVIPKITVNQAIRSIENDLGVLLPKASTSTTGLDQLLDISSHEAALIIYPKNGKDVLTRHVTVFPNVMERWEYFIDANTGQVIDKYYHTCKFHYDFKEGHDAKPKPVLPPTTTSGSDLNGVNRQLNTWSNGTNNYMVDISKPMYNAAQSQLPDNPVGGIVTLDLRNEPPAEGVKIFHVTSSSNSWNNANGVSAHYNADVSYEYFRTTFNRNSINGQGGTIISFINVGNPDGGGGFDNAFWNGKAMFYGNGDRAFSPLAGALDVGGYFRSHD